MGNIAGTWMINPDGCINFRSFGHGQAAQKGFGANLLIDEHGGFMFLQEFTPGAYPDNRHPKLEERFTHAPNVPGG
jgi:hypothetical protein